MFTVKGDIYHLTEEFQLVVAASGNGFCLNINSGFIIL